MQSVIPALRVSSYADAKVFYSRLGFQEQWKHQFTPDLPVFASIVRDGMEIFLTEHKDDCQFGGLVHFYVPDVDAWYDEFTGRGAPIAQGPGTAAHFLGGPLDAAPARLAPVHRFVLVRAAVCHQVAQRATHRLNGRLAGRRRAASPSHEWDSGPR